MKRTLVVIIVGLLFFASCDIAELDGFVPRQPENYRTLIDYCQEDARISRAEFTPDSVFIRFFDGSVLGVNRFLFPIDDCTDGKEMSFVDKGNDDYWYVDGIKTRYPVNKSKSAADALPVYIGYDGAKLVVYLSNDSVYCLKSFENLYPSVNGSVPVIKFTTDDGVVPKKKDAYHWGKISIMDVDGTYSDSLYLSCRARIKCRGNSTFNLFDKKPYKFRLVEKHQVLGIHKSKSWVLLANSSDKTMLRNVFAMELCRICGFSWTPEMRHVSLYINNQYQGLYTLSEERTVAKHRVDIDLEAGDVYLEVDARADAPKVFKAPRSKLYIDFREPKYPTPAQMDTIKALFSRFETSLLPKDGSSAEYIDYESWVNFAVLNTAIKNVDGIMDLSTFFTVKPGGKLVIPHMWDFDIACGNSEHLDNPEPDGWWVINKSIWLRQLIKDPYFLELFQQRWHELYPDFLAAVGYIDQQADLISKAQVDNFKKWHYLGVHLWSNYKVFDTWEEEVAYFRDYYLRRLEWVNNNIDNLKPYKEKKPEDQ